MIDELLYFLSQGKYKISREELRIRNTIFFLMLILTGLIVGFIFTSNYWLIAAFIPILVLTLFLYYYFDKKYTSSGINHIITVKKSLKGELNNKGLLKKEKVKEIVALTNQKIADLKYPYIISRTIATTLFLPLWNAYVQKIFSYTVDINFHLAIFILFTVFILIITLFFSPLLLTFHNNILESRLGQLKKLNQYLEEIAIELNQ